MQLAVGECIGAGVRAIAIGGGLAGKAGVSPGGYSRVATNRGKYGCRCRRGAGCRDNRLDPAGHTDYPHVSGRGTCKGTYGVPPEQGRLQGGQQKCQVQNNGGAGRKTRGDSE